MVSKIADFLSSFGMMLAGVLILFYFTVTCYTSGVSCVSPFPAAKKITATPPHMGENFPKSRPAAPLAKDDSVFPGDLTAASALVMDTKSRALLYAKNKDEIRSLASISKLMSAMVLLDLPINWASTTVITDADYEGGDHNVAIGEKYSLRDLWNVALVGSSNIAMSALVRSSGISQEEFVARMNRKAEEAKLRSLRFVEPTGLSEKNMGNIFDVAKLLTLALKQDKIYSALRIGQYSAHPLGQKQDKKIWSTNWLLTDWVPNEFKAEDIAGKTGYIVDSRYNFVVNLSDSGRHNIVVAVLGADTNEHRFSEARDLAEWAYSHYLWPDDGGYLRSE